MKILLDNFMRLRRSMGNPAGDLFHVEHAVFATVQGKEIVARSCFALVEAKARRRLVPELNFALRKIYGPPVDATLCPGLEPAYLKAEIPQTAGIPFIYREHRFTVAVQANF